jgi:hypothetical protein
MFGASQKNTKYFGIVSRERIMECCWQYGGVGWKTPISTQ